MKYINYLLVTVLLLTGCVQPPSPKLKSISYGNYEEVSFEAIPSWEKEDFLKAFELFTKTCKKTSSKELYKVSCEKAHILFAHKAKAVKAFFEKNFTPFVSLSSKSLATGYYEPFLEGSLEKTDEFSYPVYGVPQDLLHIDLPKAYKERLRHPIRGRMVKDNVKPYFTRKQINSNALGSQVPICYVNDNVDLFFLHVQGSGCVKLEDDSLLYLGYADQNGHAYVSIGKEMIKKGLIKKEDVSLESIRSYLYEYPHQADSILNLNPSYIFFEKRLHSASGALGLTLEEGRSVAVDKNNIPLGMPLFISTTDPLNGDKYEKIVFAHDTGGAINGEGRIDIFFGSGKEAAQRAGNMKDKVKIWMLVPNEYLSKQEVKLRL